MRALKRHGITYALVAAEASKTAKFGTTSRAVVAGTLSGQYKSRNIVRTAKRLLAEVKNDSTTGRAGAGDPDRGVPGGPAGPATRLLPAVQGGRDRTGAA